MGQNSSKRRSQKHGRGKNGNTATLPLANSNDANGSIDVHQNADISSTIEGDPNTPTSPASVTPSPSNASDKSLMAKKKKRKRFRVAFSLKRTPSGRWSRKKKTPTLNGTRPVSCPDPLREKQYEISGRPQSLFLEELELHEDDTNIETVDLSDNEGKTKIVDGTKSDPRVPEKNKWRRGSHTTSSGKKKKKEKQTSKKDKNKKRKTSKDEVAVVTKSEATIPVQVTRELHSKNDKEIHNLNKEDIKDLSLFNVQEKDIDIEAVASSIVAQAVEIAQKRLMAESCNANTSISQEEDTPQTLSSEFSKFETEKPNAETGIVPSNEVPLSNDEKTITTAEIPESMARNVQDMLENIDMSLENIPEPSKHSYCHAETQNEVQAVNTKTDSVSLPATDTESTKLEIESEKFEQIMTNYSSKLQTNEKALINSEITSTNVSSRPESDQEHVNLEETDECEAIAKKTVESIITAAIETLQRENGNEDVKEENITDELKNKADKLEIGAEKDESLLAQEKCTVQLETKLNKKKQGKVNESLHEENSKNKVEESKDGKHEKQKSKSEMKIKVPKKLSNWFHKKDKQKPVVDMGIKTTVKDETKTVPTETSAVYNQDFGREQVNESSTYQVHHSPIESQSKDVLNSENTSLTLDVNGKHLVIPTTQTESSPDSNEVTNPSSSFSLSSPPASLSSTSPSVSISPTSPSVSISPTSPSVLISPTSPSVLISPISPSVSISPLSPSASISPTSLTSDSSEIVSPSSAGDKKTVSGFLKKISIGPRLRTAMLRKKSSDVSDSQEKNTPLLTSSKTVESEPTPLTPPPRKIRNRKQEKQSPNTPEIANVSSSPETCPHSPIDTEHSSIDLTLQSVSLETSSIVNDSGVADLTSPEGEKSDLSPEDTNKVDNVLKNGRESTSIISDTCEASASFHTGNISNTLVKPKIEQVNLKVHDDVDDDTRPLTNNSRDEGRKNEDNFSPLESPTLISTAVIVLRSTSCDEQVATSSKSLNTENNPDVKKQPEITDVHDTSTVSTTVGENSNGSDFAKSSSHLFHKENYNLTNTQNTSDVPALLDNKFSKELSDKEIQNVTCVKSNEKLTDLNNDKCHPKEHLKDAFPSEIINEKQFQENNSKMRAENEYQIGITDKSEHETTPRTLQEFQIGLFGDHVSSTPLYEESES